MTERPIILHGRTHRMRTGCGNLFVTVNSLEDGTPLEVFLTMGKGGGCTGVYGECVARLISMALQNGISIEEIAKHMVNLRCPSPNWMDGKQLLSCPDAAGQVLQKYLPRRESDEDRINSSGTE